MKKIPLTEEWKDGKIVPLEKTLFSKVDDDMYDFLMEFKWLAEKQENTYYALTLLPIEGVSEQKDENGKHKMMIVYMHDLVMDYDNYLKSLN